MIRKAAAPEGAALQWRKSSYSSNGPEGDCVEVATAWDAVHIRDSKNVAGPRLSVAAESWAGFVAYASGR
ncbi:DUF397 domain-containing protein [Streptomyces fradiae]|uniref:DUF397 domain-containing protein n=1 Tax=Streptomyces fradiae TaxID=1906 RepID=UPI002943C6D9|nr:DUF397 domain-containing protein [Streptomyces fradiae]WOI62756.1 DUF397 domain-containing protein [Streptomyces fradiae]